MTGKLYDPDVKAQIETLEIYKYSSSFEKVVMFDSNKLFGDSSWWIHSPCRFKSPDYAGGIKTCFQQRILNEKAAQYRNIETKGTEAYSNQFLHVY